MTATKRTLSQMQLGECRWVGHVSVHVYCSGTWEGSVYTTKVKSYKVVTEEAGYDEQSWIPLDEASSIVDAELSEIDA